MKAPLLILVSAIILCVILRLQIFTLDIQGNHAWRQTQTMWNIRNFVRHDSNILNPRDAKFNGGTDNILRLEFPIMQYTIATAQRILRSENILITRIILFIFSIFSIFGFYKLANIIFKDKLTAALSSVALLFSPLFYYYSINPLPDVFGFMCSVWYLYYISKFGISGSRNDGFFSALFIALAALSKLPFIMLGASSVFIFIRDIVKYKKVNFTSFQFLIGNLLSLALIFSWYLWVIPQWEGDFVTKGIFSSSLSLNEIKDILEFHIEYFLLRHLLYWPVWLLFIIGLIKSKFFLKHTPWLIYSFTGVFIFYIYEFSVIQYAHDYYLFPFLALLYLFVAAGISFFNRRLNPYFRFLPILFILIAPFQAYINGNPKWLNANDPINLDVYKYHVELQEIVPDNEKCIILNDESGCIFSYNIDKMGHMFSNDHLPIDWIPDMIINHDVTHMYSDSRVIDQDPAFQKYVDTMLLEAGSIHVYKLKSKEDLQDQ